MHDGTNSKPTHLRTIGQQIRHFRESVGATQDEISERCGIYRTYLSRIERGIANPTISVLVALAMALHVDIQDLLSNAKKNE